MKKRNATVLSVILVLVLGLAVTGQAAKYDALVEQAQKKLTELGYDPGPVDGLWGRKTEAAVKEFQKDNGLSITGKLDEETKVKLGLQKPKEEIKKEEAPPTAKEEPKKKPAPQNVVIPPGGVKLRNTPAELTKEEIVEMIRKYGFNHPADYANLGLSGSVAGDFPHKYELQTLEGDKVVINHVIGLMWQQAAADFVPGAEIRNHINSVNADRYAGFSDWRLPTIEELMSLLEGPEKEADFIDPIFELPLWFCASADKEKGEDNSVWVVSFEDGYVKDHLATDELYVLLVRSVR
jgi:hypothetical protein